MSELVFPSLPGQAMPEKHADEWRTTKKRSASGRDFQLQQWSIPVRHWAFKFEVLREQPSFSELTSLRALFNQMRGAGDTFLYEDPDHKTATAQSIGAVVDGQLIYLLAAPVFGFVQPIGKVNGGLTVSVNGVATTAYTLIEGRAIKFNSQPTPGHVIAWSGDFYYRCVFADDRMNFTKFGQGFYSSDGVPFRTWKA